MANIIPKVLSMLSGQDQSYSGYSLYRQFYVKTEIERVTHFQKQFDYYIGDVESIIDYTIQALKKTFSDDDIKEFQIPILLIVKRIIDRLSTAYLEPAERYLLVDKLMDEAGVTKYDEKQKKQAELFAEIIGNTNINQKIKVCYHYAKLMDVCHLQVVWRNDRIEYDVYPSHLITVKEKSNDYLKPDAVMFKTVRVNEAGEDQLLHVYWDKDFNVLYDADGKVVKQKMSDGSFVDEMPNPYKVLTTIPMRIRETENYFGEGDSSLVELNEKINILLVNAFDNTIMQSHGQAFGVNLGLESGTLKTGPRHIIEVNNVKQDDQSPSFQFVQPDSSTKDVMEFIDWLIKEASIHRGLPASSISTEVKAQSGAAKAIDTLELFEIRQDDIEALKEFEYNLYEITRAVWNYHNPIKKLDESMRFAVEFADQEIEPSEIEKLKADALKLELGLWTPVEEYIDEDNGVDESAALKIVEKNLGIRNQLNDKFGIMKSLDQAFKDTNLTQGQ